MPSNEWRRNPFTGDYVPQLVTAEAHTVAFFPEKNLYGIQLKYCPIITTPNPMEIKDANTLVLMTEKPHTLDPNANEYRVDYEAANQWGTGIVEMNSADNNKQVLCKYNHAGLVMQAAGLATLLDGQTVPSLTIDNLNATNLATFLAALTVRNPRLRNTAGSFYAELTGEPTANRVQTLADKTAAFVYDDEFEGLSSGKRQVHKDRIIGGQVGPFAAAGSTGFAFSAPQTGFYCLMCNAGNGHVYSGGSPLTPNPVSPGGGNTRVYYLTAGNYTYDVTPSIPSDGIVFFLG